MRKRQFEGAITTELFLERCELRSVELPRATTRVALQMGVLGIGPDVVLLAPARTMAVDDKPEILQGVERPIDRRRRHLRIPGTTPLDKLARGDVTDCLAQDLEDRSPLRSPAHPSFSELLANSLRFQRM
jgi:hypothetical protein